MKIPQRQFYALLRGVHAKALPPPVQEYEFDFHANILSNTASQSAAACLRAFGALACFCKARALSAALLPYHCHGLPSGDSTRPASRPRNCSTVPPSAAISAAASSSCTGGVRAAEGGGGSQWLKVKPSGTLPLTAILNA